ncbi:putative immunity protein, partial [Lactiplantibacillus plantarum]
CVRWAVASADADENALRASDQAIKLVNLTQPNDMVAVTAERQWQYDQLAGLAANIQQGLRRML